MPIKNKWLWLFLILTLLALLNIGVIATDDLANNNKVHWIRHIINELSGSWTILLLLPVLLWFFKQYPITRERFWSRFILHLFMSVIFGITHTFLMYLVRTPLYSWVNLGSYSKWYGMLEYRIVMEYFKQLIFYIVAYGSFLFLEKLRENQEQQIRAANLEQQLTKARLQSLQMQLNPHFLFNTLNAISSMMYENIDAADKMMATLSEMLRATFRIKEAEHQVEQELTLLHRYVEIMKIRFGEKLTTEFNISDPAKKAQIPVFLLQPLFENAIKYGIEANGKVCVSLSIKTKDRWLLILVEDDGPGVQGRSSNGVGWSNTLDRLEQLFGENYNFILENKTSGGLKLGVDIPLYATTPHSSG